MEPLVGSSVLPRHARCFSAVSFGADAFDVDVKLDSALFILNAHLLPNIHSAYFDPACAASLASPASVAAFRSFAVELTEATFGAFAPDEAAALVACLPSLRAATLDVTTVTNHQDRPSGARLTSALAHCESLVNLTLRDEDWDFYEGLDISPTWLDVSWPTTLTHLTIAAATLDDTTHLLLNLLAPNLTHLTLRLLALKPSVEASLQTSALLPQATFPLLHSLSLEKVKPPHLELLLTHFALSPVSSLSLIPRDFNSHLLPLLHTIFPNTLHHLFLSPSERHTHLSATSSASLLALYTTRNLPPAGCAPWLFQPFGSSTTVVSLPTEEEAGDDDDAGAEHDAVCEALERAVAFAGRTVEGIRREGDVRKGKIWLEVLRRIEEERLEWAD